MENEIHQYNIDFEKFDKFQSEIGLELIRLLSKKYSQHEAWDHLVDSISEVNNINNASQVIEDWLNIHVRK